MYEATCGTAMQFLQINSSNYFRKERERGEKKKRGVSQQLIEPTV